MAELPQNTSIILEQATDMNCANKILIATPNMAPGIFQHAVVYIHGHDDTETTGILLNTPMDIDIARSWCRDAAWSHPELIRHGGPVRQGIGYVVHTNDYIKPSTIMMNEGVCFTNTESIIRDINRGNGPHRFFLATGYCSWKPGKLEAEIKNRLWTPVDFDEDYLFHDLDHDASWHEAVRLAAETITNMILDN